MKERRKRNNGKKNLTLKTTLFDVSSGWVWEDTWFSW